jgi:hypothetical protein
VKNDQLAEVGVRLSALAEKTLADKAKGVTAKENEA